MGLSVPNTFVSTITVGIGTTFGTTLIAEGPTAPNGTGLREVARPGLEPGRNEQDASVCVPRVPCVPCVRTARRDRPGLSVQAWCQIPMQLGRQPRNPPQTNPHRHTAIYRPPSSVVGVPQAAWPERSPGQPPDGVSEPCSQRSHSPPGAGASHPTRRRLGPCSARAPPLPQGEERRCLRNLPVRDRVRPWVVCTVCATPAKNGAADAQLRTPGGGLTPTSGQIAGSTRRATNSALLGLVTRRGGFGAGGA